MAAPLLPHAELRPSYEHVGDFPVALSGAAHGRTDWVANRLILGLSQPLSARWTARLELEALTGAVAGETTEIGQDRGEDSYLVARDRRDLLRVLPRRAQVLWTPEGAQLGLGLDTFGWGMGLLANDGRQERPFGDPWRGNVVARLGGALRPWHEASGPARGIGLLLAADAVIRDENAEILLGDLALQGVGGLRWQHPRLAVGAFGAARWQRDRQDLADPRGERSTSLAFPLDLWAKARLSPEEAPVGLGLELELARVQGHTTRPYTVETAEEGAAIRSLGGALRLTAAHQPSGLGLALEGGYASGDDAPRDEVARTFRFHSDHDVGIILFEQALPLLSGAAVDGLVDPALMGSPPPGTRALVVQGVENALYAFPVLSWRPAEPLELRVGAVLARSDGDLIDPWQTALSGGYNTSYNGEIPGEKGLGTELDLGLRWRGAPRGWLAPAAKVEAALWLPGAAFAGLIEEPVLAARAVLTLAAARPEGS